MNNTQFDYLNNMQLYESQARIVEVKSTETGKKVLILDRTIFYPQGGGQQCDVGVIFSDVFNFRVDSVYYLNGMIYHEGSFTSGEPTSDSEVNLKIDSERRNLNSRLQSAGHLLLNAMNNVGQKLIAVKGYHFPDGPYVEFSGNIPEEERVSLLNKLQIEVNRLIELDIQVTSFIVSPEKVFEICKNVPQNVPFDKPTRIVTIDDFSQPCGGTHVISTKFLSGMNVEKIKSKKGNVRISYSFN